MVRTVTGPSGKVGCLTCKCIGSKSIFRSTSTKEIITRMNYTSRNVIYAIECRQCHLQYIGQTSTPLHIRMNKHKSKEKFTRGSSNGYILYKHLDKHGGIENISITPILAVENLSALIPTEQSLIEQLRTYIPYGLNSRFSLSPDSPLFPYTDQASL